jgi:hypothetical protein
MAFVDKLVFKNPEIITLMKKRDKEQHEWEDVKEYANSYSQVFFGFWIACVGVFFIIIRTIAITITGGFPEPSVIIEKFLPAAASVIPIGIDMVFLALFIIGSLLLMSALPNFMYYNTQLRIYDENKLELI